MMASWAAQRNRAGVDLIKSELVKVCYSYTCQDVYRHILDEKTLLEAEEHKSEHKIFLLIKKNF